MKKFSILCTILLVLGSVIPSSAEDTFTVQAFGGVVYNFKMPLVVRQDGQDNVRVRADFDSEPFETPMYWDVRIGWWRDRRAWELELIHDKLILKNPPPEVQHFGISHGYNILTLNRAWNPGWFIWRLGAGVVITHPESSVRGLEFQQDEGGLFGKGYYLSGPAAQIAAEKRFYIWKGFFASVEGKMTVSWVHIPIQNGNADLWNVGLHGLFGVGLDF